LYTEKTAETAEKNIAITQTALNEKHEKPHTLERFFLNYFLPLQRLSKPLSRGDFRNKDSNQPWVFTRVRTQTTLTKNSTYVFKQDPIKQPLLKKIANQSDDIQQRACQSFLDIL